MNGTAPAQNDQKPRPQQDRAPIRIERLLFQVTNGGAQLPDGLSGKSSRAVPILDAGEHGSVKIEIEHLPWIRKFRVTKTHQVTRTGKDGKEVAVWEPMGKPFEIPDDWAVSVPA